MLLFALLFASNVLMATCQPQQAPRSRGRCSSVQQCATSASQLGCWPGCCNTSLQLALCCPRLPSHTCPPPPYHPGYGGCMLPSTFMSMRYGARPWYSTITVAWGVVGSEAGRQPVVQLPSRFINISPQGAAPFVTWRLLATVARHPTALLASTVHTHFPSGLRTLLVFS
jgi:hypothetical protein